MGEAWRGDFPRSVARTFEDLEAFFLSEDRQRRLAGMGLVRRWLYFGAWLFKSLFLNLTPARRVLLALALFLLWVRAQWGAGGHALRVDFGGLAIGLLLLLLMLELKDKLVARSELQAGRVIQQALLPKEAPQVAGWDVWISTRPANEVGGDLVDFVTHEDGRVGARAGRRVRQGTAGGPLDGSAPSRRSPHVYTRRSARAVWRTASPLSSTWSSSRDRRGSAW